RTRITLEAWRIGTGSVMRVVSSCSRISGDEDVTAFSQTLQGPVESDAHKGYKCAMNDDKNSNSDKSEADGDAAVQAHSWRIEAAGATHPGQRNHNEDSWRVDEENCFYMVADGVGGRDAGEVASRIACEVTVDQVRAGTRLAPALAVANAVIRDAIAASGERASSMASTAVALHLQPEIQRFSVAWAGDSRLYLWDGELKTLTRDHSLVESLLQRGEISRAEADDHPRKNVILMALGDTERELASGENGGALPEKALFLLCSDGLSDVVPANVLCETLSRVNDSLQMRADALVQAAVDAGGRDNITAVLVSWHGADAARSQASSGVDGPVVFETFDPVSGECSRNADEDRVASIIRRVPARSEESRARIGGAASAPDLAQSGVESCSARWRWRWLLAAVALVAAGLILAEFVTPQRS
ncbi:MAG: PP2C family serine/threonine-protein phosphatase, partial [Chromatocurvus sp.]